MDNQERIADRAIAVGWSEAGAKAVADVFSLLLEVEETADRATVSICQVIAMGRLGWDELRVLNENATLITGALEMALGVPHPREMREAVGDGIAFNEALALRACALIMVDQPKYFDWARNRRAGRRAAQSMNEAFARVFKTLTRTQ